MMSFIIFLEKNGFLFMLLFCLGVLSPDLTNKVGLMDLELDERNSSISGSNLFKQVFWISLFLFFSFRFIFSEKMQPFRHLAKNRILLLILLCCVALISATWSNYPSYTIKRSIFQLIYCTSLAIAFCFVIYHNNLDSTLKIAMCICIGLTLLTVVLGVAFNSDMKLVSFTKSKNTFGINLAVLITMTYMMMKTFNFKSTSINILMLALFVLLILTQSKTSIFLVLVYMLVVNLSAFKINVTIVSLSLIFFSIFILIPGVSYYLHDYKHIALFVEPEFLTGRGIIWDALYYDLSFFNKLALGYGYGSYFEVGIIPFVLDDVYSFIRYITSAHNGYLQLLLQFGVVGSFIIFVILVSTVFNTKVLYLTAGLIIPIIHNVTEASIFRDSNMVWFMMIVIITASSITSPKRARLGEKQRIN
ncbi:MAG: exopolysaccharide production protein ExoQ [Alteromonadaceae bacterium]|jgi:exopolysaccharide production protein ExoQ